MDSESERRKYPREPVSGTARIAPYRPGDSFQGLQFEIVAMKDLSSGGFSFWTPVWPVYAQVVFPVVDTPDVMLAHVREVQRVGERWLVHCQFIRRLTEFG
jgi:hypothetical protein